MLYMTQSSFNCLGEEYLKQNKFSPFPGGKPHIQSTIYEQSKTELLATAGLAAKPLFSLLFLSNLP